MSEIFKRLKALERKQKNSVKPKVVHQDVQVENRDHEVQVLRNEAGELRQTIATPKEDREAFNQEGSELKGQLE
nr:hypothetical protein [candidate division Zixibacteria bacterium]